MTRCWEYWIPSNATPNATCNGITTNIDRIFHRLGKMMYRWIDTMQLLFLFEDRWVHPSHKHHQLTCMDVCIPPDYLNIEVVDHVPTIRSYPTNSIKYVTLEQPPLTWIPLCHLLEWNIIIISMITTIWKYFQRSFASWFWYSNRHESINWKC